MVDTINDRLVAAAEKAEAAAEIIRKVANESAGVTIPTESGPVPSLKEFLAQLAVIAENLPQLRDDVEEAVQAINDLGDQSDAAKGSALLGFDGGSLRSFLVGGLARVVPTIAELKLLTAARSTRVVVLGYLVPGDGGGGLYARDPSDTSSADNGGRLIVANDGGRWKLCQTTRATVCQYGAVATATAAAQTLAFQKALDVELRPGVPIGTYSINAPLYWNADGACLVGASMRDSVINYTGSGAFIRNPSAATVTRLFCGVTDVKIIAASIGANIVVDFKSIQFGRFTNVWVLGQQISGCVLVNLSAVWTVTECTYNYISGCVFGLCGIAVSISDGANNNLIDFSRMQVGLSSGIGVFLSGTAPGRVSSNSIDNCSFEFPGAVSNGVTILQNCDGIRVVDCRFEQLANGLVIGSTSVRDITQQGNYFESCTNDINISTGALGLKHRQIGGISFNGSGGITVFGNANDLSVVRSAAGQYSVSFTNRLRSPLPDAGYVISVSANAEQIKVTSKTTSGFTLETRNASSVLTDASIVDVSVSYNK